MHTARAIVSRGRLARVRIDWTVATDGVASEAEGGMRLTRWIAGPTRVISFNCKRATR